MNVGQRIQAARKTKGLTQKQLGERVGLATGTIQQYELGKREPKVETLQKIASALNVFITDLTGDVNTIYFESDSERMSYRLNQKIKSTGAVIFGKYVNDSYQMWMKFKDNVTISLNTDDLENLEQQIDRYVEFSLDEFERSKQNQVVESLPNDAAHPGKH